MSQVNDQEMPDFGPVDEPTETTDTFPFKLGGKVFQVKRPLHKGALAEAVRWAQRKHMTDFEKTAVVLGFFERVLGEAQYDDFLDMFDGLKESQITDMLTYIMREGTARRPLDPPPPSPPSSGMMPPPVSSTAGA